MRYIYIVAFKELEGIRVRGKNCPKPIKTWAHCGVSKKIFEALKKHGYEKPTPIQTQAIPAIMSGNQSSFLLCVCVFFVYTARDESVN